MLTIACAGFAGGWLSLPWLFPRLALSAAAGSQEVSPPPDPETDYLANIRPILDRHCFDGHSDGVRKGGVEFDTHRDLETLFADRDLWAKVRDQMDFHLMPPPDEPQPTPQERRALISWIDDRIFWVDPANPDPGVVTMRRLNRTEYRNTIRDLLGVEIDVSTLLPPDDSGYGFDNIGDVLTISAAHVERYHTAAATALDAALVPGSASHTGLIPPPVPGQEIRAWATGILENFALRAFRRPAESDEIERYLGRFEAAIERGERPESGLRDAFEVMLVSPWFLFRGELPSDDPAAAQDDKVLIDEFALASRLSYFLWSSMPDERLLGLAGRGQLRASLDDEIARMLASPKADALVSDFAGQWLQLRDVPLLAPDLKRFPDFDATLAADMRRETEELLKLVLRENLSVQTLISADFTFVNERLARHYGIPDVHGDEFRRVALGPERRGILGHASILTLTSYPTRTSPVLRGKYILETILDTPPPPPPQNIPPLESATADAGAASLRAELERHRADPNCSACHALIDPLGFGLESFDAIGRFRASENNLPVDTSGKLLNGTAFAGPAELLDILVTEHDDQFLHSITTRMLTYALGRGLTPLDRPAIDEIKSTARENGTRLIPLIRAVIHSVPFQYRRTP
ncbi:MAG: DUF1592 domain-containing protein [Luteolibacter sp.]